ncbi:M56 family metallopeptidase [Winogradskyella eckloniae]|uniref:M56 family metallopeptidase n=1 Tax=Winogradskyella eckloniae TaxID=1089306 RepID=UPI001563B303|nr:M56 family metallopeptidase [Winogradskyella eckloniae]NRD19222.1 M56 family metallopeptidase [Winogradskyella eckloniae]
METYLLKFSACLVVLWFAYVLFLERQNMHKVKRFYLLATFLLALIIPNLTITEYVEPVITNFETEPFYIPSEIDVLPPLEDASIFTVENILWFIYSIGAVLFALRFAINLLNMKRRISRNKTISKHTFIYVLLNEDFIPHSFFRYIFFNKERYETQSIPDEVLLHEETHARQLHSIDIILIEVFQIVFWFHPLIYILKHHVKLNHEFLADQAVLKQGSDAKTYQNILLQFSSNTHNHQLSSAINYSSIKKRFTVMKTQTSKTRIWLSTILILPLIAVLFYSFAEKEYVEKEFTETSAVLLDQNSNTINIIINKNEEFLINDKIGSLESPEQLLKTLPESDYTVSLKTDRETSMEFTKNVLELLTKYNVFTSSITTDEQTNKRLQIYENTNSVKYYKKQYNTYEALRAEDPHYIHKSKEEQIKMEELFSELGTLYFDMSKENKAKVKRPKSYMSPYAKVSLNGKTYYKKYDELTAEEKATLPPPPPPPAPQSPPKNPSFLEYIEDMEKQGATFLLNDIKISAEKAKSIAKTNKGKSTDMLTQKDENGKYIVKLRTSIPQTKQSILPILNGKPITSGVTTMTFTALKKLVLTIPDGEITAFKLKIPGVKTEIIAGNKITEITLKNLDSAELGDYITLFDIKDNKGSKFLPVAIEIVE